MWRLSILLRRGILGLPAGFGGGESHRKRGSALSDYDVLLADCPARTALELISGTWTIVVLVGLAHGPQRYSELLDRAGGISKKMLTQTLARAVGSGLVTRPTVRGGAYSLSVLCESLLKPLTALTAWAEEHADELAHL